MLASTDSFTLVRSSFATVSPLRWILVELGLVVNLLEVAEIAVEVNSLEVVEIAVGELARLVVIPLEVMSCLVVIALGFQVSLVCYKNIF